MANFCYVIRLLGLFVLSSQIVNKQIKTVIPGCFPMEKRINTQFLREFVHGFI